MLLPLRILPAEEHLDDSLFRIQEVEDPNYDPATAHSQYTRGKSAPNSPKPKKDKEKKKEHSKEVVVVSHFHYSSFE